MNIVVMTEWYTVLNCDLNTDHIFVFGDNLIRKGKGGQASIRDVPNSIGVATKRLPTLEEEAFFEDDNERDEKALIGDLFTLEAMLTNKEFDDKTLVFPVDGLGTGLSELPTRAPKLFDMLSKFLLQKFDIKTDKNGKLSI